MPFDPIAAKGVVSSCLAHRVHPGGQIFEKAATMLQEAINDATSAMHQIRSAEAQAVEVRQKLDTELLETKRLRDKLPLLDGSIAALRQVANAKRGGSKMAADFLAAHQIPIIEEQKPEPPPKPMTEMPGKRPVRAPLDSPRN
jgi:ribosome maturation protein Sdo1